MKLTLAKFASRTFSILFLCLLASPASGESDEHQPVAGHEPTHDFHKNLLGGFVGYTGETRRENGATLGIGYVRRVNKTFSVGALLERTSGDLDFWVYAIPFGYNAGRWKFFVAPGVEDSDHHGSEFLLRVGGEYAFEIGTWEISPYLSVDFVNGEQLGVLGFAFAKGF